jgi:hypothetical protein
MTATVAWERSPLTLTRVGMCPTRGSRLRVSAQPAPGEGSPPPAHGQAPRAPARRSPRLIPPRRRRLEGALHLVDPERFDPVTDLDVVEVLHADAALEALAHFLHVVLEALEARDAARIDQRPVANHAPGGPDDAGRTAAGDGADLADLEGLQHFGLPIRFHLLRLEQAFERRPHVFHRLVVIR